MIQAIIYADPYSGHEILLLPGKIPSGATYNPRRTDPPIAWIAGCSHCLKDSRHLSIHVRRQVQLLASQSDLRALSVREYLVPHCEHKIRHWTRPDGIQRALVFVPGADSVSVSQAPRDKLMIDGEIGSRIALRHLRFLFSGRVASPREILAVASTLADRQTADKHHRGYRTACRKVDWIRIVLETEQEVGKLAS
jgi:hypothetical protein